MTDAEKLAELRVQLLSFCEEGLELGVDIHPVQVSQILRMADILGIDPRLVPTERRNMEIAAEP